MVDQDNTPRTHTTLRARLCSAAKALIPPALIIASGVTLIFLLGLAQQLGWISEGGGNPAPVANSTAATTRYICPMLCTPPQEGPGRCPVCKMELVPAAADNGDSDGVSINVGPAARRLANIQTAAARLMPLTRSIRTVGQIEYDEGSLATITAYSEGRIERLLADYTGVRVRAGDQMARIYSPALYSAQVELVEAKRGLDGAENSSLDRVRQMQLQLFEGSRQKLIELGMTQDQVSQLEESLEPESRMYISAPIGGTVIEKRAVEGQWLKKGDPIYRIADLSTVWLLLQLFPEDAAHVRFGQRVDIEVQSAPGHVLTGRVAFIDPVVDAKTRTVGVRVVLPNEHGKLKPGDYASANITVDILPTSELGQQLVYDADMAGKWISPRHPQVIADGPGACRVCGIDLVPTLEFGFADEPIPNRDVIVVPRSAVLMAGKSSVVYVEDPPGRFEIRSVVLGEVMPEWAVILEGIADGEQVAVSGAFLLDSQMQLQGNPSLIDPTKAQPIKEPVEELDEAKLAEIAEAFAELSDEDREAAERQSICPVTKFRLGLMGPPLKVDVQGQSVFICCEACREKLLNEPDTYLPTLKHTPPNKNQAENETEDPDGAAALADLSAEDQRLARKQRICPVTKFLLGSMGTPPKVEIEGRTIFLCCEPCRVKILADPDKYLPNLQQTLSAEEEAEVVAEDPDDAAALAGLSEKDQLLARTQGICPVTKLRLGSMGTPPKVDILGRSIFICCEGCRAKLLEEPEKYLANLSEEVSP